MEKTIDIAVAIVVFNRLDCVQENLKAIRVAAPPRFYVISDGPRDNVPGEAEKVMAVRKYIEENVDWDCELIKVYAEKNMGCTRRSVSGYDEVFRHEEMAILIEDDSIGEWSFFPYCEKMLKYYKDDTRVMMIAGQNRIPSYKTDSDYIYSAMPSKYVWGTWRRAWEKYHDAEQGNFDLDAAMKWCRKYTNRRVGYYYGSKLISCKMKYPDIWDGIWDCAIFANQGIGIVPPFNMVYYIGANREDATYMKGDAEIAHLPTDNFKEEVRIRTDEVIPDRKYDIEQSYHMLQDNVFYFMRRKIAYFTYKTFPGLYGKLCKLF